MGKLETTRDRTRQTTSNLTHQTTSKPTRPPSRLSTDLLPSFFARSSTTLLPGPNQKIFIRTSPQIFFLLLKFVLPAVWAFSFEKAGTTHDHCASNDVQGSSSPRISSESGDFFLYRLPQKRRSPPATFRPSSRAPFLSFFSNPLDSRLLPFSSAPFVPPHDRPRPSRPRPISPTSPAQNRCPFRPSPRPAPLLPPPLPRRRRGAPP